MGSEAAVNGVGNREGKEPSEGRNMQKDRRKKSDRRQKMRIT